MDSFWGNIFRGNGQPRETHALLKHIPLFEKLTRREREAVARILYPRQYAAGEVIFQQGDAGVGMYIIKEGTVSVIFEPTQYLLATLHEGEFFGEIALLNETPRSATVQAKTDCTLLGFFQPDLLGLLEREPRLGVKVLLALAQIAGQRLIGSDAQVRVLQEEVARLKAERGGEVAKRPPPPPLHEDTARLTKSSKT